MIEKPRVLSYDIEATNLSASMGYVLAIGYKWLDEEKVTVLSIADYPGKKPTDDGPLLEAFRKVHDSADIVIFHFGEYYDQPFLNTRLLIHKRPPLAKVAIVDTWRIARKRLKFHSNRLDAVAKALGCPFVKTALNGNMWIDASAGDKKALKYIVHHCKMDVLVLEWCYNRIKCMWDNHPAVYGRENCVSCGGLKFRSLGRRVCAKNIYRRLVCKKCGLATKGEIIQ
jgi:uncharacterized protein YprB with RNaseH-like and TPR domain